MTGARIAIFGGAFDPIHNAHLAVARVAAARFHLDRVLFVPTFRPLHKGGFAYEPYEDRVRMVEIACAALNSTSATRFEASRLEDGAESSYSIDTITRLRSTIRPDDELFFIIGADAFAELRSWYKWQDVAQFVTFIVASRPGYSYDVPPTVKVEPLDEMHLITSSSGLREHLKTAESMLDAPIGVIQYIRSHGLYGSADK